MEILRTAILDMLRRKKNEPFFTHEVVEQMYPEDWEQFLEEVNSVALQLQQNGEIKVDKSTNVSQPTNSLKIFPPKPSQ